MDRSHSFGSLRDSKLTGLRGTVWFCADCQMPRAHFSAPDGVPVCGFCGATPAVKGLAPRKPADVTQASGGGRQPRRRD